ncbi:hypothetical protein BST81_03400 [Leptolyngbya sp. 'hensonii']|uniref:hypothetical protein n=1 Tax=Leptolyngbya sp. 'hensonii' TaxID=1922337 RepID=UPI00094FE16F|nr:hypothetical protein [Leptolyngbya sp. 'hensonii']OLP19832.1 hypothetical protein BST81_03400 [Leptolyngbya sp. 'hensonii']
MQTEFDRLLAPIAGLTFHGWRIVLVATLDPKPDLKLRFNRQPRCYASRTCLYLVTHYLCIWR